MSKLQVDYSPDDDTVGIFWTDVPPDSASEVTPDIVLSYDTEGNVVGIEFERGAKQILGGMIAQKEVISTVSERLQARLGAGAIDEVAAVLALWSAFLGDVPFEAPKALASAPRQSPRPAGTPRQQ